MPSLVAKAPDRVLAPDDRGILVVKNPVEPWRQTDADVILGVLRAYEQGAPMMIKKLSAVGNSLGLIIERPILELLDITKDTPLEVRTDGEALIISPVRKAPLVDRSLAAADRLMDAHEETYRKLAK